MKKKGKKRNLFWAALVLGVLFCTMLLDGTGIAAEDTSQSGSAAFDIDAQLLSSDDATYDIQLTLRNRGENWEGTVRVQMDSAYDSRSCAYDTVLSLPQDSTKQFVVRIPFGSIDDQDDPLKVSLLDKKGNVLAEKSYKRFVLDGADALSMGILSDSYQSLTYLDMGGEGVYYGGIEFPINLVELTQDNLAGSLDLLKFLVIDDYNTGILTDQDSDRIRQWVSDGGMLIVGTGARAEDTLSGLDFLDIECIRVNEPGESIYGGDYGAGLEQLSLADLKDMTGRFYTADSESLIMVSSWNDGAVEIVPYALSDLGRAAQFIEECESYVWELLQNANYYVSSSQMYANQYYDNASYIIGSIFESFGNGGDRLSFGWLKLIVVVYVIVAGPVLYLVLRAVKKRDWYWGAVPVTVLVGILLVYFAGSGFEVVNTRVYSVTVENLSGGAVNPSGRDNVTYMHCYDAGHKEWGLQLADRYDYAGPFLGRYYYGNADGSYRYHVRGEGDRIAVGLNPDSAFEDGYFLAGTSQNMEDGSISSDLASSVKWGIAGTVTNGTSRDFRYFAVIADDELYIYDRLPAGQTCTLGEPVYSSWGGGNDSALSAAQEYVRYERDKEHDMIAALGTGISEMYIRENYSGETMVIGIVEDWYKTMEDNCSETAYGCLYAVQ